MNKGERVVDSNGTHSIQPMARRSGIAYRAIDCLYWVSRRSPSAADETRTSKERSGRTTNARITGPSERCRIRRELGALGAERERLETTSEPIRRPMLSGEMGRKEKERDQGGGGKECPFSSSKGFGAGYEGERYNVEVVPVTK